MALIERLQGEAGYSKIATHQFWAQFVEYSLGEIAQTDIESFWEMDAGDISDMTWLTGKYSASTGKKEFVQLMHVIFLLAEAKHPGYETKSEITARINAIS